MDNLGDILYVVALVGALIYSAVKKANKNNEETYTPETSTQDSYEMDELRDLFKPQIKAKNKPEVKVVSPAEQQQIVSTSNLTTETKTTTISVVEDEYKSILDEEFDIRKAVVYSAILDRPYH